MSHDHIELQRYFSETTSSISSVPNGNMSGGGGGSMSVSESFTSGTPTPAVQHTDADDTQNPTYSSIPEAQSIHQKYRAARKAPAGGVPAPSGPAPSGNGLPENSETQYEFIPESKHTYSHQGSTGITMQADNILYAETAEALRHQTLTMDRQHYKGSMTPEPHDYNKEAAGSGCSCKKACLVLVVLVLLLVLVTALAAGVLSVAIIFTGFVDICKCTATTPTNPGSSGSLVELTARVQALEIMVEELQMERNSASSASPVTTSTTPLTTLSATTMSVTTPTSPTPFLEGVVTLREVDVFQNCSTSVEQTCTIVVGVGEGAGVGTGSCLTPAVFINRPGEFTLNMNCVRAEETQEPNPLIGTLEVFENEATCICSVPDLDAAGRRQFDVECGIQVTRCVSPLNITVMISDEL